MGRDRNLPNKGDVQTFNGSEWVPLSFMQAAVVAGFLLLVDAITYFIDDVDATKRVRFQLSGLTTGTDRLWSFPDRDDTFAGLGAQSFTGVQTFTNNVVQSGATTHVTGTGTFTHNGDTIIATGKSLSLVNGNITLAATGSGAGTVKVYTNAARNAFVARFNDSNSQGGFFISSSGECYFATNNDISGGVDTYSRGTIPPARWGNPLGGSTTPFVIQYAAAGASGATITWTTGFTLGVAGSVILGSAALATTATDGFLYIPSCAGTPTGVPTAVTGRAPLVIDSTNNKLYFYSGGAWRDAGP